MKKKKHKISNRKWVSNREDILTKNSTEYIAMMDLAYSNAVYNQVLHNGHIAVELILKAAFCKYRKKQPFGHWILQLVGYTINDTSILYSINTDPDTNIQDSFNSIYTAWDMQYRYQERSLDQTEAILYLNAYKEAYKWIKTKYRI